MFELLSKILFQESELMLFYLLGVANNFSISLLRLGSAHRIRQLADSGIE
jgi:hypothetical protein